MQSNDYQKEIERVLASLSSKINNSIPDDQPNSNLSLPKTTATLKINKLGLLACLNPSLTSEVNLIIDQRKKNSMFLSNRLVTPPQDLLDLQ